MEGEPAQPSRLRACRALPGLLAGGEEVAACLSARTPPALRRCRRTAWAVLPAHSLRPCLPVCPCSPASPRPSRLARVPCRMEPQRGKERARPLAFSSPQPARSGYPARLPQPGACPPSLGLRRPCSPSAGPLPPLLRPGRCLAARCRGACRLPPSIVPCAAVACACCCSPCFQPGLRLPALAPWAACLLPPWGRAAALRLLPAVPWPALPPAAVGLLPALPCAAVPGLPALPRCVLACLPCPAGPARWTSPPVCWRPLPLWDRRGQVKKGGWRFSNFRKLWASYMKRTEIAVRLPFFVLRLQVRGANAPQLGPGAASPAVC